ncbi:GNAT family N-acetyltransferase [Pulveribacter suum]|uniref:GNAT family N-acetyltransferase n=2 Tax=Pulveribacter suum TaxID=2116657 RepID=A0A2P1NQ39_9BURK|nr:GNAT family N-acetyltransferase [Pulveribacter suum]
MPAGTAPLRPHRHSPRGSAMNSVMVPIRALGPQHRARVAAHLLALPERDRYLRFGYPATDAQVERYVELLNFERDEVLGIFNRKLELIALAHVAFSASQEYSRCAEFGVSVSGSARGRGFGARLFDRAILLARHRGVSMMFIHALTENTAMLKIARNAGATVQRDGPESEAWLELPPAGFDTRVSKLMAEHFGEVDYQLKKQAHQFWRLLADVQEIRRGVREGRHQAGE